MANLKTKTERRENPLGVIAGFASLLNFYAFDLRCKRCAAKIGTLRFVVKAFFRRIPLSTLLMRGLRKPVCRSIR